MNSTDFERIESELDVSVPAEYRQVMAAQAIELQHLVDNYRGHHRGFMALYFDAEEVVFNNLNERGEDTATGSAFPDWEQTFFLIGDNMSGDYYCLRRDGGPGVWIIGSDCGDEPSEHSSDLASYVESLASEIHEEMGDPEQAVAVPFLSESEWESLAAIVPDPEALGGSYREWEELANDEYRNHRREKRNPRRVLINAAPFLNWCQSTGCAPDSAARKSFAEHQLETEEPWLKKHRGRRG